MTERIWITWEWQRRSIELSKNLGCKLYILNHKGLLRYPIAIARSLLIFAKEKPRYLFVQNPSMLLATLACLIRPLSNTALIIDRHSNFLFSRPNKSRLYKKVFKIISQFTIKHADLTLVTNEHIAGIVINDGGNPFILPDKLPSLSYEKKTSISYNKSILMISSFDPDEPINNVFQAMRNLEDEGVLLFISGNYKKLNRNIRLQKPDNIKFTGFMPEHDFVNMLFSVDAVMALTTIDHCMLCGCYEAIAAKKPLITSDKKVLKEYFKNMIYVDNKAPGIAKGIKQIFHDIEKYKKNATHLNKILSTGWEKEFALLEKTLRSISN